MLQYMASTVKAHTNITAMADDYQKRMRLIQSRGRKGNREWFRTPLMTKAACFLSSLFRKY